MARTVAGYRMVRETPLYPTAYDRRRRVASPSDVIPILGPLADVEEVEVFWVLLMNGRHQLIAPGPITVTRGLLTSALICGREVFRPAILLGASAMVFAHNHPTGDPTPSLEDIAVTERFWRIGAVLGIDVVDHVILGSGTRAIHSMAEMGQMPMTDEDDRAVIRECNQRDL